MKVFFIFECGMTGEVCIRKSWNTTFFRWYLTTPSTYEG